MVTVRQAHGHDHRSLAQLQWRWRVEEWRGHAEMTEAEFVDALTAWAAENAETHTPFVALEGDDPVGMAWLALILRVPTPPRWTRRGGLMQSVYVVPGRRNAGVGASLVGAVIAHARALGLDYLLVHPSDRSVPLYRRMGFAAMDHHLELLLDR
jgi:GNAT superfamily N-acetyltransferase